MPASRPENHVSCEQLPPLAAEDHACDVCAVVYSHMTINDAVNVINGLPAAIGDAISAIPSQACRVRRRRQVWSVAEYLCHVRDVYSLQLQRVSASKLPARKDVTGTASRPVCPARPGIWL